MSAEPAGLSDQPAAAAATDVRTGWGRTAPHEHSTRAREATAGWGKPGETCTDSTEGA